MLEAGQLPGVHCPGREHSSAGKEKALETRGPGASGLRGLLESPGQGVVAELEMARKPLDGSRAAVGVGSGSVPGNREGTACLLTPRSPLSESTSEGTFSPNVPGGMGLPQALCHLWLRRRHCPGRHRLGHPCSRRATGATCPQKRGAVGVASGEVLCVIVCAGWGGVALCLCV